MGHEKQRWNVGDMARCLLETIRINQSLQQRTTCSALGQNIETELREQGSVLVREDRIIERNMGMVLAECCKLNRLTLAAATDYA